jgi:hypothetical protein
MSTRAAPRQKFRLSLWSCQPNSDRGYPGRLFTRSYESRDSAKRALAVLRRTRPLATQAEIQRFELQSIFWMSRGDAERVYFCPSCGASLDWCADQWACPGCCDEFSDDQIREGMADRS